MTGTKKRSIVHRSMDLKAGGTKCGFKFFWLFLEGEKLPIYVYIYIFIYIHISMFIFGS